MSNYAIWNLIGPLSWIFWLALIALLLARPSPKWSRRFLLLSLGWFAMAGFSPLGLLLMKPLELRFERLPLSDLPKTSFIAVLGGAERMGASQMSQRSEYNAHADRVIAGAELAFALPDSELAIIGGVTYPGSAVRDVDIVHRTWIGLGIPSNRLRKIGGTRDTCTNAVGVAKSTSRPIILVTSAFHMPRSVACFRASGLKALPFPVDFETPPIAGWRDLFRGNILDNLNRTDVALHEYVGLVVYRVSGRIKEIWPEPIAASVARAPETRLSAKSP